MAAGIVPAGILRFIPRRHLPTDQAHGAVRADNARVGAPGIDGKVVMIAVARHEDGDQGYQRGAVQRMEQRDFRPTGRVTLRQQAQQRLVKCRQPRRIGCAQHHAPDHRTGG